MPIADEQLAYGFSLFLRLRLAFVLLVAQCTFTILLTVAECGLEATVWQ